MYNGHMNNNINPPNEMIPCVYSSPSSSTPPEFFAHFSTTTSSLPPPLSIPVNEYDHSLCALKSEFGYSNSSGSTTGYNSPRSFTSYSTTNYNSNSTNNYGSPTSLTSYESNYNSSLMQRSTSSHSLLHRNNNSAEAFPGLNVNSSSPTACYDDNETSPVRKVYSAGDLEGMTPKQHSHRPDISLASEYSIIESMSKACRYSPEEKKERIERYRSKRNLRNFNKKIKYECRKTLADSRPRIRGRFARNDEIEKASQSQWDQAGIEAELDEDDDNWINILGTFSASLMQ